MSEIESQYRREIGGWSGQERVQRTADLLAEIQNVLSRKIKAADPSLDSATLRRRVAECLYRTDPETQRLLARLEE